MTSLPWVSLTHINSSQILFSLFSICRLLFSYAIIQFSGLNTRSVFRWADRHDGKVNAASSVGSAGHDYSRCSCKNNLRVSGRHKGSSGKEYPLTTTSQLHRRRIRPSWWSSCSRIVSLHSVWSDSLNIGRYLRGIWVSRYCSGQRKMRRFFSSKLAMIKAKIFMCRLASNASIVLKVEVQTDTTLQVAQWGSLANNDPLLRWDFFVKVIRMFPAQKNRRHTVLTSDLVSHRWRDHKQIRASSMEHNGRRILCRDRTTSRCQASGGLLS